MRLKKKKAGGAHGAGKKIGIKYKNKANCRGVTSVKKLCIVH